jgi:leucyl-tRNA synthetase
MAPVIPHDCEELWGELNCDGFVSHAKWPKADESLIDKEAEAGEDYVMNALEDARRIIKRLKKKPSKLLITVASKAKLAALKKGLQADNPEESGLEGALADYAGKSFYELKEARFVDEFSHLEQAREFYSRELRVEVEIEREEGARNRKAERAMPLKPALFFE